MSDIIKEAVRLARVSAMSADDIAAALSTTQPTPTTAGVTEALVKALKPFACIADSEPNTPDGESTIVNISRCRDARAALGKFEAALAGGGK
jgi:hypothetical protein